MNSCKISSFQSLGTVDGPGVRAVVFMQGCPLRCHCCHNPETWDIKGGNEITSEELLNKISRCEKYFGANGGVTFSGGEPLLQAEFLKAFIPQLKERNINVAIDTSGCILNDTVKDVLSLCDLVLLDCKYTNEEDYQKYTGMSYRAFKEFIEYLELTNKDTWIKQVIIPGINDNEDSISALSYLSKKYNCVKKIELLPFRKLCTEKYKNENIVFPFENVPEASNDDIKRCTSYM